MWTIPIDQMQEDYEVPQENGNRVDVRWCAVSTEPFEGSEEKAEAAGGAGEGEGKGNGKAGSSIVAKTFSSSHGNPPSSEKSSNPFLPTLRASLIPLPLSPTTNTTPQLLQFSTQIYDAYTIESATHPCDLLSPGKQRKGALWKLNAEYAGLGTAACGPGTEEEHQVKTGERRWGVRVEVLEGGGRDWEGGGERGWVRK